MSRDLFIVLDYGAGNVRSVAKSFEHIINECDVKADIKISADLKDVENAKKIIVPGQGAFGDCMQGLKNNPELLPLLNYKVLAQKTPFLGICVGMQLLSTKGFEMGEYEGLSWIEGETIKMSVEKPLKLPHMGWNKIEIIQDHPALQYIQDGEYFYFVHSFMVKYKNRKNLIAQTDYNGLFSSIIGDEHILGVQFHPEKSQKAGLNLLRGFCEL